MKKVVLFLTLILLSTVVFTAGVAAAARDGGDESGDAGLVVIANRGSGSISVIDVQTGALVGTYDLPGENSAEPMYVTYSRQGNHVFVGDRANDQVVVFDAADFSVVGAIPTGAGVWHMWADPRDQILWVNNDIDNTATVIDPQALTVIATVPMPADLVAGGFVPHDVIIEPGGRYAYVTMLGGESENDYLIQFSTKTFRERNRAAVGKDPHVSLTRRNELIYVPAQNSDVVGVFSRNTLQRVTEIEVPGAHGAAMSTNGKVFYTTNLPGGGTDGLFAIDVHTNTPIGSIDTPYAGPHNVVATNNNKLFLTHSGPTSDKVTIYAVSAGDPVPALIGEVTVGLNPFGLGYVP